MKILITGCAGFIGGNVSEFFLNIGDDVLGVDDFSTGNIKNTHANVDCIDITDRVHLFGAFRQFVPNVCIHLAAQPSLIVSSAHPGFDAKVNILGTINVIEACKLVECKKIIFSSTSAVYAPRARLPISETSPTNPDSNYGISKYAAEMYIKNSGLEYAILRLANVYGPLQVPLGQNQLIPRVLDHIIQGKEFEIYGHGQQIRDYIYINDVVRAISTIIDENISGIFNISTCMGSRTIDVVLMIADLLSKSIDLRYGSEKDRRNVVMDNLLFQSVSSWKPKTDLKTGLVATIGAYGINH